MYLLSIYYVPEISRSENNTALKKSDSALYIVVTEAGTHFICQNDSDKQFVKKHSVLRDYVTVKYVLKYKN